MRDGKICLRFILAVLGQLKRGKSSLMNAIIGRELLPTGVLPLTSAITALRYGLVERLVVHREGLTFSKELPVSAPGRLCNRKRQSIESKEGKGRIYS
ncbi:MAG: dynamin family protein [Firmicutes bacterium]|nr:dynamin family protein [Bacillota bacterium]